MIKCTKRPSQVKFNALLMLKELTKTEEESVINYTSKKILNRLYLLAISPQKEKCLVVFDPNADLRGSGYFYHLLLECFSKWGDSFTVRNQNYTAKKRNLINLQRLPVMEKHWDIPSLIQLPGRVNVLR